MSGASATALLAAGSGVNAADWAQKQAAAKHRASTLERVREAKQARLTCSELFCSKGLGSLLLIPSLGLGGFVTVPTNTGAWRVQNARMEARGCANEQAAVPSRHRRPVTSRLCPPLPLFSRCHLQVLQA